MPDTPTPSTADIDAIAKCDALRLVIPYHTSTGNHWAPHRYSTKPASEIVSSEIVLTRVRPDNYLTMPAAEPILDLDQAPADAPTIVIDDLLGTNPYDYYNAWLRPPAQSDGDDADDSPGLIAQFVEVFSARGRSVQLLLETYHMHMNELAPLQGRCIPRFGGLFRHGPLYCLVFEDGGREITDIEWRDTPIRHEMIQAMLDINAVKVAPFLYKWRYFRRGLDGRVKIIIDEARTLPQFQAKPAPEGVTDTPEERIDIVCAGSLHFAHEELFHLYERKENPKYIWCCDNA